ncbi:MAG: acyl carrier protein [Bdellovibrionales bacterium]|nr:acyl carrier protein [Bdellovibrionales bacterium]
MSRGPWANAELTDDTNLIERGIVESINAISLVIFLENEFGVQVNSGDLIGSNFQSINHIVAFIEKKKGLSWPIAHSTSTPFSIRRAKTSRCTPCKSGFTPQKKLVP